MPQADTNDDFGETVDTTIGPSTRDPLDTLCQLALTCERPLLTSQCVSRTTKRWKRMRRDRIARALSGLRRILWARVQMGRRPDGPGSGAPRTLADVSY